MIKTKLAVLVAISLLACNSSKVSKGPQSRDGMQDNTTNSKETANGWLILFDDSSLKGWHAHGKPNTVGSWKVQDGAIYLDTKAPAGGGRRPSGDLLTDEEFENYHLQYDWKISPNGNSGVIFNVHEDTVQYKNTYNTGPEMQVLDNDGHPDAKIHKHRAGDLYDLIASSKETVKPVGQWNHAEIILNKGKLEFHLNGEKIVSTTMWDDNWNQMVANSKFKTMPGFAKYKTGRIALQDHGNEVWFRNIKIKRL